MKIDLLFRKNNKKYRKRLQSCGFERAKKLKENIMAGYPHFYFHNCREVAERFVDMAEKISKNLSM